VVAAAGYPAADVIRQIDLRQATLEESQPARRPDLRLHVLGEDPAYGLVRWVPWWEVAWDAVMARAWLTFALTVILVVVFNLWVLAVLN
jgi:hypothetical protein